MEKTMKKMFLWTGAALLLLSLSALAYYYVTHAPGAGGIAAYEEDRDCLACLESLGIRDYQKTRLGVLATVYGSRSEEMMGELIRCLEERGFVLKRDNTEEREDPDDPEIRGRERIILMEKGKTKVSISLWETDGNSRLSFSCVWGEAP